MRTHAIMTPLNALSLFLLVATTSITSADPQYMLIAPTWIRPDLDYQVSLHYIGNETVDVELKVVDGQATLVEVTRSQEPGTFELYNLQIPDSIQKQKRYALNVTGRQGDTVMFHNSTDLTFFRLRVSTKTSMMFIQTDKGIYQPESTIKFRVMSVTRDLLLNPETFDVSIRDPAGNKVKGWDDITLNETAPVFSGEYQLADRIMFGNWRIEVETTQLENEMVTVKVEPYVLPRFDVKVATTPVMLYADGSIDGEVSATNDVAASYYGLNQPQLLAASLGNRHHHTLIRYSYGKGVKGTMEIQLMDRFGKSQPNPLTMPIDGKASFMMEFTEDELKAWGCRADQQWRNGEDPRPVEEPAVEPAVEPTVEPAVEPAVEPTAEPDVEGKNESAGMEKVDSDLTTDMPPEYHSKCILALRVVVTEELSGSTQEYTTLVSLYKDIEKITFNNPATLLKPGLTYKGTVSVAQQDGSPLVLENEMLVIEAQFNVVVDMCSVCHNETDIKLNGRVIDRNEFKRDILDRLRQLIAIRNDPIIADPDLPQTKPTLPPSFTPILPCDEDTPNDTYCFNTVERCDTYYGCYDRSVTEKSLPIPGNGIVSYEFNVPDMADMAKIRAQYKDHIYANHYVYSRFDSGNGKSLELKAVAEPHAVGSDMTFRLRPSVNISQAFVLVAAKGMLVYTNVVDITSDVTEFSILATADMAPLCTVIVYFIHDGEVIADIVNTKMSGIFRNKVSASFSLKEQDVGESVTLDITAEPNSFVYILAIDKTVLQLAEANDVTEETVEDKLGAFELLSGSGNGDCLECDWMVNRKKRDIGMRWSSPPMNTEEVIMDAGLIYLTDISVYGYYYRWDEVAELAENEMARDSPDASSSSDNADVARTNFPETWLWMSEMTGDNGQVLLDVTLPDTITTWIATSFAMHPTAGLGIADIPTEIIGSRQFFVYPNLPVSLVRGEIFDLDISVFNYAASKSDVEATVSLEAASEWYEILSGNAETITIPHTGAVTTTFKLAPLKPGRMPIRISAVAPVGPDNILRDNVLKYIRVFPEGQQITEVKEDQIEVAAYNSPLVTNYTLKFPEFIVPDSKYVKITVSGNIMGPTIEGLESLVRRPVGCGEQNIITLVPNIYVRDLLESINKITPELTEKTTSNMEHGVQRELVYQRTDGSFSAFKARLSDPNDHGSTWLTAFVVQSFTEAIPYVTIDPKILEHSLDFILAKQNSSGLFVEDGRVIHKTMQGGTAGGLTNTMAAYMLITMLMAQDHVKLSLTAEISLTQTLLETVVTADTDDPYLLAITAYALQLAESSYADALVDKLNTIAITDGGSRHWEVPHTTDSTAKISYYTSGPSDVEMTAYVLKTYVLRNEIKNGHKVMKWLAQQRNANGGFYRTQDTVLALGALTAFYKETYNTKDLDVKIDLTIDGTAQSWTLTEDNADILYSFEMENPSGNDVRIVATGEGKVIVQVIWSYNEEVITDDALIGVKLGPKKEESPEDGSRRKRDTGVTDMELCLQVAEEVQDMAICEIYHPSGHVISLGELDSYVDATEISDKTVFYYRQLPANYSSCSYFQFIIENQVENLKPAHSVCYFYYQSGSGTSKPYTTTGLDPEPVTLVLSSGEGFADTLMNSTPPSPDTGTDPSPVDTDTGTDPSPVDTDTDDQNSNSLGNIAHARFEVISIFLALLAVLFLLSDQK